MEKESNRGSGILNALGGLVFIVLLFGIFTMIFRELKRGSILMWIYVIAVSIYVSIYGLC